MATNIYKAHYSLDSAAWKNVSPEAKKFVSSLLQKDPKQRPSASKALQSPWLMKEYNLKDRAPNAERMQEIEEGLIKSRQASKFQKLACMMIAYRMPAEQLKELRAAFDAIDTSNEGTITYDEFRAALKDKHDYSHAELKQMFNALDENQSGVINYTEFLSATLLTRKRHEDGSIRAVFDKIDKDNTGLINREELKSIIVDQSTTEDAEHLVDEVLESMDKDHDGKISYDEFLSLFNEKNKM